MSGAKVEITDRDVEFVRQAGEHYRLFAETCERNGQSRTAGIFRAQEFYAERFLSRIEGAGGQP